MGSKIYKNEHSIFTYLFMSIAGIFFVCIAIVPFILIAHNKIEDNYIRKNGILIDAEVVYIRNESEENVSIYEIKYEIIEKEKTYNYYFEDYPGKYAKSKKIKVYYLKDNPEKVYVEGERKYQLVEILKSFFTITPFSALLGYVFLKNYNIFKYRKYIVKKVGLYERD